MGADGHICSMFPGSPTLTTLLTPSLKPAVYGVPPAATARGRRRSG
jgi:6-phosphogluconolactonase